MASRLSANTQQTFHLSVDPTSVFLQALPDPHSLTLLFENREPADACKSRDYLLSYMVLEASSAYRGA